MTWRDGEVWSNIGFSNDESNVDETERDENYVEDISGYEKSVWQRGSFLNDLILMSFHATLRYMPAVFEKDNWLSHKILFSPRFSSRFPASPVTSPFVILNSAITSKLKRTPLLSISAWHDCELTLSTVYTSYFIHLILHHCKIDCLLLSASLITLGRQFCPPFSTLPHVQVTH